MAFLHLGAWHTVIALGIAALEAILIAFFFMHARYSTGITRVVIAGGVVVRATDRRNAGRRLNEGLDGDTRPVNSDTTREDALDHEPKEIAERADLVGRDRLHRSSLDILITAIIGGIEVSIGGLAAMSVVGAALAVDPGLPLYAALALAGLVFPIGFIFVILGRSELFTENFLIPVVAVLNGGRPLRMLFELFTLSWIGNLVGSIIISALLVVPDAVGHPILEGYRAYAAYKLAVPLPGVFTSALLAGLVMTALTWALLAIHNTVADVFAIFSAGYVLFGANLSHSIIGASLIFVGFAAAGKTLVDVAAWIAVATIGNLIGGVGLVTLFRIVQAREQGKQP